MNYWLIKSEPDDFGIDDLQRKGVEPWTGVRNYQARNYMRDSMKKGDLALFYHSNISPAGVVGLAEIGSDPYADPTQFDSHSEYFDPKSSPDAPRWQLVDMHFREKFPRMVTLDEMRTDSALEGLLVTKRGMRLSVQPVTKEHFEHIVALARA
jgi:predicted RNA-binding protein with PUA-like domain